MAMRSDQERDELGEVIRAAGRRAPVPVDVQARVYSAAAAALERKLASRRQFRPWAAAAAVLLTLGLFLGLATRWLQPAITVAASDRLIGASRTRSGPGAAWAPLAAHAKLLAGAEVRTGPGSRAGFVLGAGWSLRLDEGTEVRLESATRIRLIRGRLYADCGHRPGVSSGTMEVTTDLGAIRDVGTQFEVSYAGQRQRVRVREGAISMALGDRIYQGGAGEQLIVEATGVVMRDRFSAADPGWQWVQLIARTPDIDNRPLSELLAWVARETGRRLQYASPTVERLTRTTILHGNIRDLEPLPAARTMLATTDFELVILPDGSLLVKGRARGDRIR